MNAGIHVFCKDMQRYFKGNILEVGSLDVNGTVRNEIPITIGIDVVEGKCVDVVMDACKLTEVYGEQHFDGVVSTSMLEHCFEWQQALEEMWKVLKPSGTFLFTVPTERKKYHGYPNDYWRFDEDLLKSMFAGNRVYGIYRDIQNTGICVRKDGDLSFNGIKLKTVRQ